MISILILRDRNINPLQWDDLLILVVKIIVVLQNKVYQLCSIDTTYDRSVLKIYLCVLCIVRKCYEQTIITLAHSTLEGLYSCLLDVTIAALNLHKDPGREFIFVCDDINTAITTLRGHGCPVSHSTKKLCNELLKIISFKLSAKLLQYEILSRFDDVISCCSDAFILGIINNYTFFEVLIY